MKRSPRAFAFLSLLSLPLASPALALDCTSPSSLECGVTSSGITIGNGAVPADPTWCNGQSAGNTFAHIFEITLTGGTEISISATNPVVELFLLDSCDQDACTVSAVGQGTATVSGCVPAGSYTVAATTLVDAIFVYSVSTTCTPCEPVSTELRSWGLLKGHFP